jgi:F-type H+-transporting ATPase subunit alpha
MSAPEQVAVLLAAAEGIFDALPPHQVAVAGKRIQEAVTGGLPDLCSRIGSGVKLSEEDRSQLLELGRNMVSEEDDGKTQVS